MSEKPPGPQNRAGMNPGANISFALGIISLVVALIFIVWMELERVDRRSQDTLDLVCAIAGYVNISLLGLTIIATRREPLQWSTFAGVAMAAIGPIALLAYVIFAAFVSISD